jgi:hypothetical protein
MKALLYCYRESAFNNWLGLARAGVLCRPMTAPPLSDQTFPYDRLRDVDLVYIALHGSPAQTEMLFADAAMTQPAFSSAFLSTVAPSMAGSVVILEGCWGLATIFPEIFQDLGASAVIASQKPTYDRLRGLGSAGALMSRVVGALKRGAPVGEALERAKNKVDKGRDQGFVIVGEPTSRLRSLV